MKHRKRHDETTPPTTLQEYLALLARRRAEQAARATQEARRAPQPPEPVPEPPAASLSPYATFWDA